MHIDAFFDFLLKKPHPYYIQIPPSNSTQPGSRDGVPTDEDLALRALLPETRPRRGRRKNEERDDASLSKSPARRPRLTSPTLSEDFHLARSAIVPEISSSIHHSFDERSIPWSAVDQQGQISAFRWPPNDNNNNSILPSHPVYPQSAITPTMSHTWDADEPQSALIPRTRVRRRHGPAVSSAWSSSSSGKLRGRPPSNRSVQQGPFSTFPAKPHVSNGRVSKDAVPHLFTNDITRHETLDTSNQSARPGRLSLQVPERQGGKVRLATPPPTVVVNDHDRVSAEVSHSPQRSQSIRSDFTIDTYATRDVAPLQLVSTPEVRPAKVSRMALLRQPHDPDTTNVRVVEEHIIAEILSAKWISSSTIVDTTQIQEPERCSVLEAEKIAKEIIVIIKNQAFSEEMFLLNLCSVTGGGLLSGGITMERITSPSDHQGGQEQQTEDCNVTTYKMTREMRFGSFGKTFAFLVKIATTQADRPRAENKINEEVDWKHKYETLRSDIFESREQEKKAHQKLLAAVLSTAGLAKI